MKGCGDDGRIEILVVDDERSIAESLQCFLEGIGYRVVTAGDGAEALRVFRERRMPLVLSDINMPGLERPRAAARDQGRLAPTPR